MSNEQRKPLNLEQKIVEEAKRTLKETKNPLRQCISDAILSNINMSEMNQMAIFLSDYVDYIAKKIKEDEKNV